jgi:hypothetical protein
MQKNTISTNFLRWLTICLLFALSALLFFANLMTSSAQSANNSTPTAPIAVRTSGSTHHTPTPTRNISTATPTTNTPTVSAQPNDMSLNTNFPSGIDPNIFVQSQIEPNLQDGQKVAIVAIYVGFLTPSTINDAQSLYIQIKKALKASNNHNFANALYYPVIFTNTITTAKGTTVKGTPDLSQAELEIYLYNP